VLALLLSLMQAPVLPAVTAALLVAVLLLLTLALLELVASTRPLELQVHHAGKQAKMGVTTAVMAAAAPVVSWQPASGCWQLALEVLPYQLWHHWLLLPCSKGSAAPGSRPKALQPASVVSENNIAS
jgi:hypothetical protein